MKSKTFNPGYMVVTTAPIFVMSANQSSYWGFLVAAFLLVFFSVWGILHYRKNKKDN